MTVFAAFAGNGPSASARLQEATPGTAATPEAETTPETVNVVTLVGWYMQDPSGEFLTIGPLRTNDNLVAGPAEVTDRSLTGQVNFTDESNDGQPRITLGDSAFEARAVYEDDPDSTQRWLYYNDDPTLRPATLVMQIVATRGPYENYRGTATFVSRAADAGGVIIIVLNPPAE
jgi:hypothetical protein